MALTGQIIYKGLTLPNAYVQIAQVRGGPKDNGYTGLLRIYANQASRLADINNYLYEYGMQKPAPYVAGSDPFVACFNSLSAVGGEFAGFSDVL